MCTSPAAFRLLHKLATCCLKLPIYTLKNNDDGNT